VFLARSQLREHDHLVIRACSATLRQGH
jgi:hypothetical protein